MKTTVLLVLLAVTHGVKSEISKTKPKTGIPGNAGKRELEEGNVFGKRAPVLATASPSLSTGIEYADNKETLPDKSPSQQTYETPLPQIAKISDVLTGQGPFQAAIAGHLYSPVSVYQQRIPTPTYEVTAPVPSQLAYSEHRVSIPNFIQYSPKQQKAKGNPTYNQPQYEQIQQLLQQVPNNHFFQPYQYNPAIQFAQQLPYQQIFSSAQPGIIYANQEQENDQRYQQIIQRDLKGHSSPSQNLQQQNIQTFNSKPQNAQSYATFIYNPVDSNGQQHQQIQLQQSQIQPQQIQGLIQPQYQNQLQEQQVQLQPQQVQIQPPPQIQYQLQHPLQSQRYNEARLQSHNQYQPEIQQQRYVIQPSQLQNQQPQLQFKQQLQSHQYDVNPTHSKPFQRQAILKQDNSQQIQEFQQPQIQNIGYSAIPAPVFPPVQYFGKFAPSFSNNYQH